MSCILIDDDKHRNNEEHSYFPQSPICIPVSLFRKLKIFSTVCSIILAVILSTAFIIIVKNNYQEWHDAPKTDPVMVILTLIQIFILAHMFISMACVKLYRLFKFKKLQNPYQGKILSCSNPHYLQHTEYYKKHGTWIIPDGTDLNMYNPEIKIYRELHKSINSNKAAD